MASVEFTLNRHSMTADSVVPLGAIIVNYSRCCYCHQLYLLDSTGRDICGRRFCVSLRQSQSISNVSKRTYGHLIDRSAWWRAEAKHDRAAAHKARHRGHHALRLV